MLSKDERAVSFSSWDSRDARRGKGLIGELSGGEVGKAGGDKVKCPLEEGGMG